MEGSKNGKDSRSPGARTKLEKTETDLNKEMNVQSQELLGEEFIPVRNLSFIFIDIVPYDKKSKMILGLRQLFEYDRQPITKRLADIRIDRIPDISVGGSLQIASNVTLGTIANSKYYEEPLMAVTRELPDFLDSITVDIHHLVPFAYCIVYSCIIHESHHDTDIEETFIHSDDFVTEHWPEGKAGPIMQQRLRGPKLEPSMNHFQKVTIEFLQEFSYGLFINSDPRIGKRKQGICPNIKILLNEEVGFEQIKEWLRDHYRYINYLDIDYPGVARKGAFLIGYQKSRSFGKATTAAGLTLLYSKKHFPKEKGFDSLDSQVAFQGFNLCLSLLGHLAMLYYSNYNLEIRLPQFRETRERILEEVSTVTDLTQRFAIFYLLDKENMERLESANRRTMNLSRAFGEFDLDESSNSEEMRKRLEWFERNFKFEKLDTGWKLDLDESIRNSTKEILDMASGKRRHIRSRVESLLDHLGNLTTYLLVKGNIKLQNQISWFTLIVLIAMVFSLVIGLRG
ncbi:MAG: hypothetical protein KAR39_02815 [Thermoplasmata archaeon]|nr:hypothetical protein [Thermoplasmata archaeon]